MRVYDLTLSRPRFIEILDGLDETFRLLSPSYKFDVTCFQKLEELALGMKYYLPTATERGFGNEHRRPKSMDEAAYAGSKAAIVHQHRSRVAAQKERYSRQEEAYWRKVHAENELAVLETEKLELEWIGMQEEENESE